MDSELQRIEMANQRGAHACARELATRYVRQAPDSCEGWHQLAKALLALGVLAECRSAVERAMALAQNRPRAGLFLTLGKVRAAGGDHLAAIIAYERAAELEPSSSTCTSIGQAYLALGKDQEATRALQRQLPGDCFEFGPAVSVERGKLLLALGQNESAAKEFTAALVVLDARHEEAAAGLRDAEQVLALLGAAPVADGPRPPHAFNLVRRLRDTRA